MKASERITDFNTIIKNNLPPNQVNALLQRRCSFQHDSELLRIGRMACHHWSILLFVPLQLMFEMRANFFDGRFILISGNLKEYKRENIRFKHF